MPYIGCLARRIVTLLALTIWLLPLGCSTLERPIANDARLYAADIDVLNGPPWVGTLTYLDYQSHQHTTIDSSLMVRRTRNEPAIWEFGVGYAKEPHADSKETLALSADGRRFGDELVVSRTPLRGGGVLFITETDGEDDHRAARFRFEHSITAHEYSRRKLVRFKSESEFFERHIYQWKRSTGAAVGAGASDRISPADLRADAALLRRALEAVHPGLYRYNTKEQMAANFEALDAAFGRDLTMQEAFLALSQFTAKIKCGHTFPNPNNQSKAVKAALFTRQDKVPFFFRWIDGRMIVTKDLTEEKRLKPGTEILEINDFPAGVILKTLMTSASADGSNDAKRVSLLEVTGGSGFETFDIYFPLFFPLSSPVLKLKIRPPAGGAPTILNQVALTYVSRQTTDGIRDAAPEGADQPLWALSYLPDGTAYLPMATWVAYKTKWDWTKFLNGTFDKLIENNVANLVIDLRGNGGGSSVGDVIIARLVENAVPASPNQQFVRYLRTPAELDAALDTWDPSFKDWSKQAIGPMDLVDRATGLAAGTTSGFYRLKDAVAGDGSEVEEMITPVGRRYRGRVFVLVDAANSSATFEFASQVKSLKLGTLVGQPTGGNQRGINGGAFFFLRLPNTGFEVDLPIKAQFPKPGMTEREDAGIMPDVIVARLAEDLASGADPELRAVKALTRSK